METQNIETFEIEFDFKCLGIEGLEPSRFSMDQRIFTLAKSGLSLYPPINKLV